MDCRRRRGFLTVAGWDLIPPIHEQRNDAMKNMLLVALTCTTL
jgi:hypothetical protein